MPPLGRQRKIACHRNLRTQKPRHQQPTAPGRYLQPRGGSRAGRSCPRGHPVWDSQTGLKEPPQTYRVSSVSDWGPGIPVFKRDAPGVRNAAYLGSGESRPFPFLLAVYLGSDDSLLRGEAVFGYLG